MFESRVGRFRVKFACSPPSCPGLIRFHHTLQKLDSRVHWGL